MIQSLLSKSPFLMYSSSLYGQYGRMFSLIPLKMSGQPNRIIFLSSHSVSSAFVAWCICVNFPDENWTKSTLVSRLNSPLAFCCVALKMHLRVSFPYQGSIQQSYHTLVGIVTFVGDKAEVQSDFLGLSFPMACDHFPLRRHIYIYIYIYMSWITHFWK